jgi:hypothetical protein
MSKGKMRGMEKEYLLIVMRQRILRFQSYTHPPFFSTARTKKMLSHNYIRKSLRAWQLRVGGNCQIYCIRFSKYNFPYPNKKSRAHE